MNARVWDERVAISAMGAIPSLDAPLVATRIHMLSGLQPSAMPRKPLPSDGGDLLHMTYLPYADVLRCDSYASRVVEETATKLGLPTRIARSPEDALAIAGA